MFGLFHCNAQGQFNAKVEQVSININGERRVGYKTVFDFSREEVRHSWWKYAKRFGRPINMKSYYKVIVPSSETDGNVDIEIIAQTSETTKGSIFFLGLENEAYKEQVKGILIDFKKDLYVKGLIREIKSIENKCSELAENYRKSRAGKFLDLIAKNQRKTEILKNEIIVIEKSNFL